MTTPVDVLAVLDEAQDWLYRSSECRGDDERAVDVKEARAAVAELIEAGALVAHERLGEGPAKRWRNMERFRAALARVQGGAK